MADGRDSWLTQDLQFGDQFVLTRSLDTRAEGHWARVVGARRIGQNDLFALKIMRSSHIASGVDGPAGASNRNVYKMFYHEARILDHLGRHEETRGRINTLRGWGYVRLPEQHRQRRVGLESCDSLDEFERQMPERRGQWLPFLALETILYERSLLHLAGGISRAPNQMLPLAEWFEIARQGLQFLAACHRQNIFYIDHKLEHVMWDGQKVRFIDWNVTEWEQDETGGKRPWSREMLRYKTWRDLRHFTALVLFPLLTRHTIDTEGTNPANGQSFVQRGRRPIEAYSGNVSIDRIYLPKGVADFHEDGIPLFDDDLKSILSQAMQNEPGSGFESAQQFLDALDAYWQIWRAEAQGFDGYLTAYFDAVRKLQQEIHDTEQGLQELLKDRAGQVGSHPRGIYLEIGRLYRSVKELRKSTVLPEYGGRA